MRVLLVTLGGSDYPSAPDLRHDAFSASNRQIVGLLSDPEAPLVADDDKLELFNDNRYWPAQLVHVRDWIKSRIGSPTGPKPSDLIIHYVGHGSFKANSLDYYLTINVTDDEERADTSIVLTGLHNVLRKHGRHLRIIIVIDACLRRLHGAICKVAS